MSSPSASKPLSLHWWKERDMSHGLEPALYYLKAGRSGGDGNDE